MARKHEAVDLLNEGYSPSRIARKMGISVTSVMGYLYNQVGEGRIRRSDIVFAIERGLREAVESLISESKAKNPGFESDPTYAERYCTKLNTNGVRADEEDVRAYLTLRDARLAMGDMYEFIRDIEIFIHRLIRSTLSQSHGATEWWRKGIPVIIRKECAAAHEEDPEPADDPFCYTNFIHLQIIIEKNWNQFSAVLPKVVVRDPKQLFSDLKKLNRLRNSIMHPIKGWVLTEDEFRFVLDFMKSFDIPTTRPIIRRGNPPIVVTLADLGEVTQRFLIAGREQG